MSHVTRAHTHTHTHTHTHIHTHTHTHTHTHSHTHIREGFDAPACGFMQVIECVAMYCSCAMYYIEILEFVTIPLSKKKRNTHYSHDTFLLRNVLQFVAVC